MRDFNERGLLCGRPLSPARMLDGLAGGDIKVMGEAHDARLSADGPVRRFAFMGIFGLGVLGVTAYATFFARMIGNDALAHVIKVVASPALILAVAGIALLKCISFDDEHGAVSTLVTDGRHVVYIKSYATEGDGGDGPVMRVSITHVTIGEGTATRTLGGVSFSRAERYRLEVPADAVPGIADLAIADEAYAGIGTLYVPDAFEVPLAEILGDWMDSDGWIWADPGEAGAVPASG